MSTELPTIIGKQNIGRKNMKSYYKTEVYMYIKTKKAVSLLNAYNLSILLVILLFLSQNIHIGQITGNLFTIYIQMG